MLIGAFSSISKIMYQQYHLNFKYKLFVLLNYIIYVLMKA